MLTVEQIAKVCHETCRCYNLLLGDDSLRSWSESEDWQKESCIIGVKSILQNPDMTPEESHNGWLAVKRADGWKYGEIKDSVLKTHPCVVEYDELPMEQRIKDELFVSIVTSLM
ncbi:hypothetical protein CL89_gp255 [Aeromonas phage PX29]|uniref:Ryanodine receptor Ryr domain-containing protein n=1 Tax=Aeromonas phage PX29 TaxID=926067 RepID=E5DQF6_9CAUD|nr:hypothetical protein CL89_gp255 [Aeromonas phage PX29]ADQ52942.1 conserved hypothetical protein [Aeromonas phage PX29]